MCKLNHRLKASAQLVMCVVVCVFAKSANAETKTTFSLYKSQLPLSKSGEKDMQQLVSLQKQLLESETIENYKSYIAAIEAVHKKTSGWLDGQWMLSLALADLSMAHRVRKSEFPKAVKLLNEAETVARKCLSMSAENPLCSYALANALGERAAIEGIIASLRIGKEMQSHLKAVMASKVEHRFWSGKTLQSNTRHALGMFRRLVPDSMMVSLTFGIRGNLEESVKLHKEARKVHIGKACSQLLLGVSLHCYGDDEDEEELLKKGLSHIKQAAEKELPQFDERICIRDAALLLQKPSETCSYHRANYSD